MQIQQPLPFCEKNIKFAPFGSLRAVFAPNHAPTKTLRLILVSKLPCQFLKLASGIHEVKPPEADSELEGLKQRVDLVPGKVLKLPPNLLEQKFRVSLLPFGHAADIGVTDGEEPRLPEVVQAADAQVLGELHHLQKDQRQ